jgi:hypothetical protein
MSTLREAAQQALEAMDKATRYMSDSDYMKLNQAIDDLKVALEQEEPNNDCHAQCICQRSGYSIGGITPAELSAALGWPGGISTPVLGKVELLRMVAQQEQEPVAWRYQNSNTEREYLVWNKGTGGRNWTPLYTHPLRREWQGLMNKEIVQIVTDNLTGGDWIDVARAIEQALKEKNNG